MTQASNVSVIVHWKSTSRDDFERLANMLLVRDREQSQPHLIAQAVDGRGGDGGIDIDVTDPRTGQVVEILQLKHFPEGIPSRGTRRRQVEKSYKSALQHAPQQWTLVTPRNLTPEERKWVRTLKGRGGPEFRFVGETELDLLLARYPDIHKWAIRDPLREALTYVNRRSATLSKPGDLQAEVQRLEDAQSGRSAYWGWQFSGGPLGQSQRLVALRPDAAAREPLEVRLELDFTGHEEVHRSFRNTIGLGGDQPVELPSSVVRQFIQTGPEWFADSSENVSVLVRPETAERRMGTLVTLERQGQRVGRISGDITHVNEGPLGGTLVFDCVGGLTFRVRLPTERVEGSEDSEVSFDFEGHSANDALKAILFAQKLTSADSLTLRPVEAGPLTIGLALGGKDAFPFPHDLVALIDDLAAIERHADVSFECDLDAIETEQVRIRMLRMVLDGKRAVAPLKQTLAVSIDTARVRIEDIPTHGELTKTDTEFTMPLLGRTVEVGSVILQNSRMGIADRVDLEKRMKAASGGSLPYELSVLDDCPWTICLAPEAGASLPPLEPWGFEDIDEHIGFERATAGEFGAPSPPKTE